jgi:hypothetical protein
MDLGSVGNVPQELWDLALERFQLPVQQLTPLLPMNGTDTFFRELFDSGLARETWQSQIGQVSPEVCLELLWVLFGVIQKRR